MRDGRALPRRERAPQDRNRVYLHTSDSDRLLHTFRLTAGLGDWARAAEGGLAFRITGQPRPLSLVPLNRVFGQRYAVYWRVRQA